MSLSRVNALPTLIRRSLLLPRLSHQSGHQCIRNQQQKLHCIHFRCFHPPQKLLGSIIGGEIRTIHSSPCFRKSAIANMAEGSAAAPEGTQNTGTEAVAVATSAAKSNPDATTVQDTKSDNSNNTTDEQSKSSTANPAKKNNNKQRKAARWKQLNQKKKEKKRQRMVDQQQKYDEEGGDKKKNKKSKLNSWKKEYDQGTVEPNAGSFANEDMRKLFNVDIPTSDAAQDKDTDADDNNNKIPKRKLALLVSFLGTSYSGFQINASKRTLQSEIELGLYKAGIISQRNFGHPQKYSWSNSARTDKGVHAAAQVCSLKGEMIFHNTLGEEKVKEQLDAMRIRVNECLPEDIRVLDFERVTRAFCARTNRDKVRYQYMVPSYMLASREEVRKAFAASNMATVQAGLDNKTITPMEAAKIVEETISDEVLDRAREALVGYRVSSEQMERLRDGLKLFEGTHCFHNYTRRVGANDASAVRYILSFRPLDPIIVPSKNSGGGDGTEEGGGDDGSNQKPETQWIPLQVVGQSFLLNQIRKMVSAAVDLARNTATTEQITQSLTKEHRMKVNVAPAQGLFLDRSYFELYNKHKVEKVPKHGDSRDRDILDWVEMEGEEMPPAVRRIEEFKNEKIIPHIVQEEDADGNFLRYLYAQDVLYADQIYGPRDDDNAATGDNKVAKKNIDQNDDDDDDCVSETAEKSDD